MWLNGYGHFHLPLSLLEHDTRFREAAWGLQDVPDYRTEPCEQLLCEGFPRGLTGRTGSKS